VSGANPYLTGERLAIQTHARRFATEAVPPLECEYGRARFGVCAYALIIEELPRGWMSVNRMLGRAR
jgi:hypothetical protein